MPRHRVGHDDVLSNQQRNILLHLYECHQDAADDPLYARFACWGTVWHTAGSRSNQASLSRALKRLEARGFLLRQNWISGTPGRDRPMDGPRTSATDPHARTTSVQLLPEGVAVAERLTKTLGAKC